MFSARVTWLAFVFLGLIVLPGTSASAQPTHQDRKVMLITLGPGQEVYERFSHNAIWVHDAAVSERYRDIAFNYGLFSFGGDFIYRFLMGDTQYWMDGQNAFAMLEIYKREERSIWIQTLDLTELQKEELSDFLWNNRREKNRYYNYNYYTDNCSTRIRDALNHTVGGAIAQQTKGKLTGRTYRSHTLRLMADNPFLYVCLDYVIGQPGDRDLSLWDEMFLPQYLQEHLRNVKVNGAPIVRSEETHYVSARPEPPSSPPDSLKWFILAGCSIATVILIFERLSAVSAVARVGRNVLVFSWLLLASFAGAILTFLNLATSHWATRSNENMLQLAPISIICLVLMPWAVRRKDGAPRYPRMARIAAYTALLLLALSMAGLVLKGLPSFYQDNWRIISLSLPVNAAVAIILVRAARGATQEIITEKQ